jgi:hypothetical protein
VDVEVTNSTTNPVPVSVVAPVSQPSVTCYHILGVGISGTPVAGGGSGFPASGLTCQKAGIVRLMVRRVLVVPDTASATNVVHYRYVVYLGPNSNASQQESEVLAILTDGSPERQLATPRLVDFSASEYFTVLGTCSSGVSGINTSCGGRLVLVGTPVQ